MHMKTSCIVPGSYDPVTLGHLDIIARASGLFDEVYAAVLHNSSKHYMFAPHERLAMLEQACAGLATVNVVAWEGLLVDALQHFGTDYIVRGLRTTTDFEIEQQVATANAMLYEPAQTIWMHTSPKYDAISSTIVRELLYFGADVSDFMPAGAIAAMQSFQ